MIWPFTRIRELTRRLELTVEGAERGRTAVAALEAIERVKDARIADLDAALAKAKADHAAEIANAKTHIEAHEGLNSHLRALLAQQGCRLATLDAIEAILALGKKAE